MHISAAVVNKPSKRAEVPAGPTQKPLAYTCYICGMGYGSSSLHIHIPQCKVGYPVSVVGHIILTITPSQPDQVVFFSKYVRI